jgi:hypothetical protein
MNTFSHLWQYLAEFFLEWEMFEKKVVEKIKRHFLFINFPPPPPRKSCRLWDNVEKCSGAREAADDYRDALHAGLVRRHARKHSSGHVHPHQHAWACSLTRTQRNIKYFLLFHNAPQCYVIRTLPLLLILSEACSPALWAPNLNLNLLLNEIRRRFSKC